MDLDFAGALLLSNMEVLLLAYVKINNNVYIVINIKWQTIINFTTKQTTKLVTIMVHKTLSVMIMINSIRLSLPLLQYKINIFLDFYFFKYFSNDLLR